MDRLGELAGDLIRKTERTLVSPTGCARESDAEHFVTSVGLNYLSLQIMLNLIQRPIHNRKGLSELYTAYARDLVSAAPSRQPCRGKRATKKTDVPSNVQGVRRAAQAQ